MEKSKDLPSKSHSDEQSNNETEAISSTSLVDRSESDVNHTKLEIVDQEFQNLVLEEDRNPNRVERVGHLECKYHLTPGGCKFSKACRYHHPQEKIVVEPPQKVNFLDLPMRPGKRECPFYMRTGSCKFASNCRFHHPNPSAGGSDSSYDRSSSVPFHSSAPQSVGAPWSIPRPPIDAAPYARPYMPQMPVEEFPERPGQKECQSYMNTGNCKYKSACRFHHPKTRTPKSSNPSPFSLPIRPVEMTFGADEDGHNKNHALYHRDKEELLKKAREDDTMMSTREGDIVETQNQALETRNTTVTESVTPTEPQNQLVTEPVTPTQPQNQVVDTHGTVVVKTPAPTSVEMDTVGTTPSVTPTEPQNQAVETHDTAVAKTHPRLLWRLLGRWTTSVEMDTTGTTPSVTPTKPQNQAVETHDTAVAKTPAPTSVEMDTVGTTLSATPTEPQNQAVETHTQQTNDTTAHTEQARDGSQVQEHSHTAMLEESHVQEVLGTDLTQEGSSSPKPTRVTRKRATEGGDPRETYKVPKDGPFPGGPKDCSHLKTFYDHIALMIWFGKERPPLKPVHHTKSLIGWKINNMPSHFHSRLNATGLQVLSYSLSALNRSLISTFVERWHRETSSFHLPWGEMTITLDDVKQISGLNIEGEQLRNYEFGDHEQAAELVGRTLGLNREEVRAEFKANLNQYVVSFKWLKTKMKAVELYKDSSNPNPSEEDKKKVDCIVRGYLLYALGCTLFPTKSGSRVSVYYLKYLEDLEKVNKYAWGASGLGYLYSALSSASHHDTRQIDGFLSLLEIWIYEHFTILRGKIAAGYDESQPRVKRWSHCSGDTNKQCTLIELRQKIDKITLEEIIWDPYQDLRGGSRRLVAISFYEGLLTYLGAPGRAPYMPNRVLRQFGYVQGIPVEPTSLYGEYWTQWRNHVVDPTRRVSKKPGESGYLTSYMVWYMDNTHQKCQNPDRWVEYGAGFGSVTDTPADKQIVNDTFRYLFESGFGKLVDTVGRGKRHCGSTGYDVLKEAAQDFLKCSSLIMPAREQVMEEEVEDMAKEREEEDDQKGNEFHIEMRRRSERKTKKRNVPAQSSVTIQDVVDLPPRHRFRSKRPNVVDQHKKKGKKVVK